MGDLGGMSSCGKIWKSWSAVGPSFFASSDFIDLNLMKNSVLITERQWGGGSDTGRQLPQTEVE